MKRFGRCLREITVTLCQFFLILVHKHGSRRFDSSVETKPHQAIGTYLSLLMTMAWNTT